jgi:hypothetical protein
MLIGGNRTRGSVLYPNSMKMVPRDPKCGLAPGLHAWRWALRAGELEGASICSPPLLSKAAGLRPRGPLLISPVRSRRLEAVFRSPITIVRFRAAIMRSLFPTCFFNTSPNVLRTRSPCGSIADAGLPQRRRSQHRRTVPRFPPGNPSLASDLLPLRGFSFPPDQRSIRFGTGKLVFRNSPISCRSPIIEAIASPRLRIMAPGLLPLRRLAVPQTSWNQLNSPPNPISCQSDANLRKIETQANGPVRHSGSVRTAERLHPLENTPYRVQRHTFGGTRREKWNPS